nr:hypothetical protein [Tanacetum cinerariifolium]
MVFIPYSNIWSYPKVLSPYSGHGQLANRRYPGVRDSENSQMMGHVGPTGMGRDTVQLETAVNTISHEYLLEFTSEYGIPETLHPELPGPEDRIVDLPEGKVGGGCPLVRGRGRIPPMLHQALGLSQELEQPLLLGGRESVPDHQPEMLLCLVRISRRYYLGDEVYPTFLHDDDRDMDMFNLIRALNPTKVKTGSRPRAAHEVPLLTLTANRVVEMEDPAGVVAPKVPPPEDVPAVSAPEVGQAEEVAATDPSAATESRKRGRDGADVNAPAKVLRRDHADPRPTGSTRGGKSLAAIELGLASTRPVPAPENPPAGVSDPDPLSFADPQSRHPADIAQSSQGTAAAGDPESGNASFASAVGSPDSIYRPEWGVPNGSMLDTPEACQDLVNHVAPPGYFSELRHLHNDDILRQYNVNLARQVAMGSQLRLRFEQEAKLLRKSVAQVARRDKRIQARELEIKNLEALLEAEADMKTAAKDKSAGLSQELKDMRARFSDLQVSNERLSQQVATLQEQVSGEGKLKAAFEEFKQYEDSRVEQQCAEMDVRLDALSIDFDEELYPHMLTAIAGRRWVIGRGMRLAVMKCDKSIEQRQAFADVVSAGIAKGISEGLRHGVEHGQAQLSLESIEAYDPEAEAKYVAALQALKDLKYPLVDQLEGLKDAPMDVRDPMNPWAFKEEMLLADAIAANISRAEQKKKCRIVCRTHGVGSAHHVRSDGVPVSVPTVVSQGLAILLVDAATQTELEEAI